MAFKINPKTNVCETVLDSEANKSWKPCTAGQLGMKAGVSTGTIGTHGSGISNFGNKSFDSAEPKPEEAKTETEKKKINWGKVALWGGIGLGVALVLTVTIVATRAAKANKTV
jgi:hypothetical protein